MFQGPDSPELEFLVPDIGPQAEYLGILYQSTYSPAEFQNDPLIIRVFASCASGVIYLSSSASFTEQFLSILVSLGLVGNRQAIESFRNNYLLKREFGENFVKLPKLQQGYKKYSNLTDMAYCCLQILQKVQKLSLPFTLAEVQQFIIDYSKCQISRQAMPCFLKAVVGAYELDLTNYKMVCQQLDAAKYPVRKNQDQLRAQLPGIVLVQRQSLIIESKYPCDRTPESSAPVSIDMRTPHCSEAKEQGRAQDRSLSQICKESCSLV